MLNSKPMQLARKISYSGIGRVRIGAVLVNKKIIIQGHNDCSKTHPIISKGTHKGIHAECACLIGNNRSTLVGGTIYVYREDREGRISLAKPCPCCRAILKAFGISKCYYTDPKKPGYVGELNLKKEL